MMGRRVQPPSRHHCRARAGAPRIAAACLRAFLRVACPCRSRRAAQTEFLTFRQQIRPRRQARPLAPQKERQGRRPDAREGERDQLRTPPTTWLRRSANVQIYYNGATIEADRVVYDQKTKRLRARRQFPA